MEPDQHTNAETELICGTWSAKSLGSDGCWLLQREPVEYGQWFEFHEDGGFVDGYSAPCGNDSWLHHWTGNWKFGEDGRTLILKIENYPVRSRFQLLRPTESYRKGQEIRIIKITKEQMQLQVEDPVDQLWECEKYDPYSL